MSDFRSSVFAAGAFDYQALVDELTTKLACELITDSDTSNRSSTDTSTFIDHDYAVTLEEDEVCLAFFQVNYSQNNGGSGYAQFAFSATGAELGAVGGAFAELSSFDIQTISDVDTGRGVHSAVFSVTVEDVADTVTFLARGSNLSSGDGLYVWFSEWNFIIAKKRKFHERLFN